MVSAERPEGLVLVFEIGNNQGAYARCLDCICRFEKTYTNAENTPNNFYDLIEKYSAEDFIFHVNRNRGGPGDKMESALRPGEYARVPVDSSEEKILLKNAFDSWRINMGQEKAPLYHIRVKFTYENSGYQNLENLQFLAMLLQQVYYICYGTGEIVNQKNIRDKLNKRLSVFLIPEHNLKIPYDFGDEDPNADTDLFFLASQYLRLVAKIHNGVIYGWSTNKVTALEFTERKRNIPFFPLLYLTKKSPTDNYTLIFENSGLPIAKDDKTPIDTIRKGFTFNIGEKDSRPFGNAGEEDPHVAIADLIMDEARKRLLFSFAFLSDKMRKDKEFKPDQILVFGREEIKPYIDFISEFISKYDRFTFALFSQLLILENKVNIRETIEETIRLASELGDGIRQLVQNSLQHSEHAECYLSFFKTKGIDPFGKEEEQLCIRVTDLNPKRTVIDTFKKTLETENKFHIFEKVELSIAHLVSDFNSEKNILDAWRNYRRSDASAHIGLTMFFNTLKLCQCRDLQILSCTEYEFKDKNEYNTNFDYSIYSAKKLHPDVKYVIPGMQTGFYIPITAIKNTQPVNLVQLANNDSFSENYDAFAHYLDYSISNDLWENQKTELSEVLKLLEYIRLDDAESKMAAQNMWKNFWYKLMNSSSRTNHVIHYCKIENDDVLEEFIKEKSKCEVFIKGFFAAASVYPEKVDQEKVNIEPSYFYFDNLPTHFVDVLQSVSVPLALMKFSEYLQVFFSCKRKPMSDDSYQPIQLLALGKYIGHVVQNAHILSLEHGEKGIVTHYYKRASEILALFNEASQNNYSQKQMPIPKKICPFTVFEQASNQKDLPQYFKQIEEIVKRPLVSRQENSRGYNFENIHMRLGNKVHAKSFYEMSFLFYRTSVANRIAFYILKKLIPTLSEPGNNNNDMPIVFYGYASYSQALIISLQEMLQQYFYKKGIKRKVYYAIYQFNLQSESFLFQSLSIARSNGNSSNPTSKNKLHVYSTLPESSLAVKTLVVQIAPIGSTLTTFDKMWAKYKKDRKEQKNEEDPGILDNYTVFIIRDKNTHSAIESELWTEINQVERTVTVNNKKLSDLKDKNIINYIIMGNSRWSKPLRCDQCFPEKVNKEKPLIETDPTSTVPYLQIYQKGEPSKNHQSEPNMDSNPERLRYLYGCVYYGHFLRGRNHYQFYINTQDYLTKLNKKGIDLLKDWLYFEKNEDIKRERENPNVTPVLKIIFSPEHNTSVGFSQSVNTYYFNGSAEIVSVNVEKQFRSNFICEHDALKQTIERLFSDHYVDDKQSIADLPVRFYYVDDTIITGSAYRRANDLLLSLIPDEYKENYKSQVFSKCFILIDRLSGSTQDSYIAMPKENFKSFCKINISNMRTHGDSCVGCKLEHEAKSLFKRSATQNIAAYWSNAAGNYRPIMFDELSKQEDYSKKAFIRMLLTHTIECFLGTDNATVRKIKDFFMLLLNPNGDDKENELIRLAYETLSPETIPERKTVCLLEHSVKILVRPFFSYNYEIKKAILTALIDICEVLLSEEDGKDIEIKKLLENSDPSGKRMLDFIKDCLFEALADIKSTYLLRKKTLKKAYEFVLNSSYDDSKILEFWHMYACYIHKIINSSGDETRSLWMEYLLLCGEEIPTDACDCDGEANGELGFFDEEKTIKEDPKIQTGVILPLYKSITGRENPEDNKTHLFYNFCMEIFLQNSRLLFDGIENAYKKSSEEQLAVNSYFMQNMTDMRKLDFEWAGFDEDSRKRDVTEAELKLFDFLNPKNKQNSGTDEKDTDIKYKEFLEVIADMIKEKYGLEEESRLRIALLTQRSEDKNINMNNLEFVSHNINYNDYSIEKAQEQYIIKKRIISAIKNKNPTGLGLTGNGHYFAFPSGNAEREIDLDNDLTDCHKPFFIIRFENNKIDPDVYLDRHIQHIDNVYIYVHFSFVEVPMQKKKEVTIPLLAMRDILSYRNCIMSMLEKDFSSHLMYAKARETGERAVLMHEKTAGHIDSSDEKLPEILWIKDKANKKMEENTDDIDNRADWLLFRQYTNVQIAKLFNRSLQSNRHRHNMDDKTTSGKTPELYVTNKSGLVAENNSASAKNFLKDIFNDKDRRIELCNEIMNFPIENLPKGNRLDERNLLSPNEEIAGYFNKEYLKCVLFDILLSCVKYWHNGNDFLKTIKELKKGKGAEDPLSWLKVFLFREDDNLMIINPAKEICCGISDGNWAKKNSEIKIQLENPIDSFDGRMSLYTIRNYVRNIRNKKDREPEFNYLVYNDSNFKDSWKSIIKSNWTTNKNNPLRDDNLWFISQLPIFAGEA